MTTLNKKELINIFKGIIPTFSGSSRQLLPSEIDVEDAFFTVNVKELTIDELLNINTGTHSYLEAIKYRIAAIFLILKDFHEISNNQCQLIPGKLIWSMVYKSIVNLNGSDILATIGSQGFLSIPLYHQDKKDISFDFLRLHVWDKSFVDQIDWEKTKTFSIHSHQFHAQSRILLGEIENQRYEIEESATSSDYSFFNIEWNNLENVNQKSSNAVNTGRFVKVAANNKELYQRDSAYEVAAGDFHKSEVNINCTSATLFLFSSTKGKVDRS